MALVKAYFPDEEETDQADVVYRLIGTNADKKKHAFKPSYMQTVLKCMSDCPDANQFKVGTST